MNKYLTEFIGTFFLVLTIGLAVKHADNLAPLAIGAGLMVMVYMGGHISGAHYNPAVSVAIFIRGKIGPVDLAIYIVTQVVAALLAGFVVTQIAGDFPRPPSSATLRSVPADLTEVLYTFALALVVLNVATAKTTQNNQFYGLAIGFAVAAGAFAGGSVSGAAFNPAVGCALTFIGGGTMENLLLYIVAPLVGSTLAAIVFKLQGNE